MKNEILNLKPESIYDVVPQEFFFELGSEQHDDYLKCNNYYEFYYAISKFYKPKKILEIGVRYGYSLGSMIKGSGMVEKVVGIDNDDYNQDSLLVAQDNLKKHISSDLEYIFLKIDSHTIPKFDEYYDLIHIDGDHTYDGKLKDLDLLKNACKIAIIDDVHHIPDVSRASHDWMEKNKDIIKSSFILDSMRGTLILEF